MKEFKLDNTPKTSSGFITPDERYFENLSANILQQLPNNEPKVISLFQKRNKIIMMVAAILVIALMIPVFMTKSTRLTEIDSADLENYLSYQSNTIQYDLINALDSEDIEKIESNIALEDQAIEEILINNNNLENFILE